MFVAGLDKDDFYNGKFLPKGSTVIHNVYYIDHDPYVSSLSVIHEC